MPPIHPAIVHFPITLVVCALIADLIAFGTRSTFWRAAGFWSWMTALVTAALAVGAGYYDMNRATLSAEADGLVHLHMRVGWTLLIVCTAVAFWRWRIEVAAPARPSALYVLASLLLFGLTAFQGWYGSEMVYAHGVSVAPTGQGTEPAEAAKQRLLAVYRALGGAEGGGHGHGHGDNDNRRATPR